MFSFGNLYHKHSAISLPIHYLVFILEELVDLYYHKMNSLQLEGLTEWPSNMNTNNTSKVKKITKLWSLKRMSPTTHYPKYQLLKQSGNKVRLGILLPLKNCKKLDYDKDKYKYKE